MSSASRNSATAQLSVKPTFQFRQAYHIRVVNQVATFFSRLRESVAWLLRKPPSDVVQSFRCTAILSSDIAQKSHHFTARLSGVSGSPAAHPVPLSSLWMTREVFFGFIAYHGLVAAMLARKAKIPWTASCSKAKAAFSRPRITYHLSKAFRRARPTGIECTVISLNNRHTSPSVQHFRVFPLELVSEITNEVSCAICFLEYAFIPEHASPTNTEKPRTPCLLRFLCPASESL